MPSAVPGRPLDTAAPAARAAGDPGRTATCAAPASRAAGAAQSGRVGSWIVGAALGARGVGTALGARGGMAGLGRVSGMRRTALASLSRPPPSYPDTRLDVGRHLQTARRLWQGAAAAGTGALCRRRARARRRGARGVGPRLCAARVVHLHWRVCVDGVGHGGTGRGARGPAPSMRRTTPARRAPPCDHRRPLFLPSGYGLACILQVLVAGRSLAAVGVHPAGRCALAAFLAHGAWMAGFLLVRDTCLTTYR